MGDNLNEASESPTFSSSIILSVTVDVSGESKEDEPTDAVTTYSYKTTPTPHLQVRKPAAPFLNRLKGKKGPTHISKIKETFSHVKINIPMLDYTQQMPLCARFLKELCITKSITAVPKRAFLASNVNSIISSQIPIK